MALRRAAAVAACAALFVLAAGVPAFSSVPLASPQLFAGGGASTTIPSTQPFPAPLDVKFKSPGFIGLGGSYTVYIPSPAANQIYSVFYVGVPQEISKFAGSGDPGSIGDGGPAAGAQLNSPKAVAGTLNLGTLIADSGNNKIRSVDSPGNITTAAGTGTAGTHDGAAIGDATFDGPSALSPSANGYFVLQNAGVVRRVENGQVTTIPNAFISATSLAAINDTDFWLGTPNGVIKSFLDTNNSNTRTTIGYASGRNVTSVVALNSGGAIVYDAAQGNGSIVQINPGSSDTTIASNLSSAFISYQLPGYLAIDDSGLWFTQYGDPSVNPAYGTVWRIPTLTVTSKPPGVTQSTDANFTFASWDVNATLTCRLDMVQGNPIPFTDCANVLPASNLYEGHHRLDVAVGVDGGTRGSGFTWVWVVDHTAPNPTTLVAPADASTTGTPTPTFSWNTTTDPAGSTNGWIGSQTNAGVEHYELWIDNQKASANVPASCTSPCSAQSILQLDNGGHTWFVKAVDGAGNGSISTTRQFTVDTREPNPAVPVSPDDGVDLSDTQPTLTWHLPDQSGKQPVTEFDVELDGVALGLHLPASTLSYKVATPLAEGPHTWHVLATNAAGKTSTSDPRTFRVDNTPPVASLTIAPNPVIQGGTATLDGSASSDPSAGHIVRYEFDTDGDGLYEHDNGNNPRFGHVFTTAGTHVVGVRVTDGIGLTGTATASVRVTSPVATGGPSGVTINNGAQYTRTPEVTLFINAPQGTTSLLVANDGGFLKAKTLQPAAEIPWTLDSSGPERLPKTVYVRFLTGPLSSPNFTDDIILDETPPKVDQVAITPAAGSAAVRAAKVGTWNVKVKATDSNSGVDAVQVTASKKKPGSFIKYRTKLQVRSAKRPKFIRARDRAGNLSRWRGTKKR